MRTFLNFAVALLMLAAPVAYAQQPQVSCSGISASSVTGTYGPTSRLNLMGSIDLTCTRSAGPQQRTVWLGIDDGPGTPARHLERTGGGATLPYGLYRNAGYTGSWSLGAGQATGSTAAGGAFVRFDFRTGDTLSATLNYYLQILANQYVRAGTYSDNPVTLTARLESHTGALLGSATFWPTIEVADFCRVATPPGNLTLNYTSFSGTAATSNTTFGVQCMNGTAYGLGLDATTGSALGLTYSLGLSATGGSGNGLEQQHTISGSIAPGQAGRCPTGSCTTTQTRTLTISY